MTVTAKELMRLGFEEGPELGRALAHVRREGLAGIDLIEWVADNLPPSKLTPQRAPEIAFNLDVEDEAEAENVAAVRRTMNALMKTPTLRAGAVMPDACPSGPEGTIPVGGVVAAEKAIHPGMHSADICCSVMVTDLGPADPKAVLDAVHSVTHFGPSRRAADPRFALPREMAEAFRANWFLNDQKIMGLAESHLGTQGDGNHFAYVGVSKATGATCLVTHHGSRGPGAGLYRKGMAAAERWRVKLSKGVLQHNAWIPADEKDGVAYWEALQLIRGWTKLNHGLIHDAAAAAARAGVRDRFWNEHNFVFREGDLYWHAKGATPVNNALMPDTNGVQIVPLNMAEPILLIRGGKTARGLGFAPHGAGRNFSRSAHKRALAGRPDEEVFAAETAGIDARFYCGRIDVSELPSAYKPAWTVRAQMDRFGLAETVDEIAPYGSIMAGDWEWDAPWRKKARARQAAAARKEARG